MGLHQNLSAGSPRRLGGRRHRWRLSMSGHLSWGRRERPGRRNVSALTVRGIDRILGGFSESGFHAEWDCLPASAFGAYHERDRVFIVAYDAGVYGGSHDLLEAGREWRASLQSRRFSCMAMATERRNSTKRFGCEPELARLVRRVPGAMDRLSALGDSVYPAIAEWIGQRIIQFAKE